MTTPQPRPPAARSAALIAVYLGLSMLLTFVHGDRVNLNPAFSRLRAQRHQEVVHHTGKAPYVYRILVPAAAESLRRAATGSLPRNLARELPYLGLRWLFTFGALLLFHRFLKTWLEPAWVIAGVFLLAFLHPPSYLHYWYQPASALDLLLWLAAASITLSPASGWWLVPIVALGAFNRETVVFVPLIHWALSAGRESWPVVVLRSAVMFVVWAFVFVTLRLYWVGPRPRVVTMEAVIRENLNNPDWAAFAVVFFGALWILPLLQWRRLPSSLKRLGLVLVPYLALQLIFGRIREVRLILPLALFLIPASLLYLSSASCETGDHEAG